jgi:hypothetical protein
MISVLGLVLSFVACAAGVYGCTERSTSRWGQPEDFVTYVFAGLAYLGLVGAATAVTLFVRSLVFVWKKRRGLN